MFTTKQETDERARKRSGIRRPIYTAILRPHLQRVDHSVSGFCQALTERLDSIERRPLIFGQVRSRKINGLQEGLYDVLFDTYSWTNPGDEIDVEVPEPETFKIGVFDANGHTDMLIIPRVSRPARRILESLVEIPPGIPSQDLELYRRADLFDREFVSSDLDARELIPDYFDAEDMSRFDQIYGLMRRTAANIFGVQQYFCQMASLSLSGWFADDTAKIVLAGFGGLRVDPKWGPLEDLSPFWSFQHPIVKTSPDIAIMDPDEEKTAGLRELVGNRWYENGDLKRPLNMRRLMTTLDQIGHAYRSDYEQQGSRTERTAIAAENFVTELYEAFTGKETSEGQDDIPFIGKLEAIADATGTRELLQPMLDVYTEDKKISPRRVRGGLVHNGSAGFGERDRALDVWTSYYYQDLAKTLLSIVGGEPIVFYDFNRFAASHGLDRGEGACASISPAISKTYMVRSANRGVK